MNDPEDIKLYADLFDEIKLCIISKENRFAKHLFMNCVQRNGNVEYERGFSDGFEFAKKQFLKNIKNLSKGI